MEPSSFQATVQWVLAHGYTLLFVLMFIEGPAVTAAGAFAAALGYFNIWIVFFLSVLANLLPDALYYAMGYYGRHGIVDKYGRYFGVTPERMAMAEKVAETHSVKSLFAIKLIPFLATPGLILVGASKMNIKKFAFWSTVITVPSSGAYLLLGYYFGAAYDRIEHYLHIGTYVIVAAILVVGVVIYLQRKYSERFFKDLEK